MSQHSIQNIHKEHVLEAHLVGRLIADHGYVERGSDRYNRKLALDPGLAIEFVRTTQADEWAKLEKHYVGSAEAEFLKQLEAALKSIGTLGVLRRGIKLIPGIKFSLCFFRPASSLNADLVERYQANILSATRQVRYSLKNENAIDVVLFVNGIPVVTIELKNELTGSTFRTAEQQYRKDRSPAGEPLLTFKRGALVHFAMDESNVSMTTRLMNGKTRFLPFNRGRDGGAGNRDFPGDFRTAYLWSDADGAKAVFSRDVLLDVIGNYVHLDVQEVPLPDGKVETRETMIFPRFHQLDAVRSMMADASAHGPGRNYLVQHSAGSGKSNTIAWTAHRAIELHDAADQPIFDTAVIVTDRVVLDRQLQRTIGQFAQTAGVVKQIDGTSRQLKDALAGGARIIVTTIQKFSTEHLATISGQGGRRFAVIVDEAHGSQSGRSAQALADALIGGIGGRRMRSSSTNLPGWIDGRPFTCRPPDGPKDIMRLIPIVLLTALAACSGSNAPDGTGNLIAASSPAPSGAAEPARSVQTAAGRYQVDLAASLDRSTLPQNADLKMADGDLTQYAVKLCGLDFANKLRPDRCELFVQPDRSGLLVGYAVLMQGAKASIETAVETDRQRTGLGCGISGDLENSDYEHPSAKLSIGEDFEARMSYAAWEKDPGNWMVAPVSDDADQEGAIGVWYFKRPDDKLRITQERWSYCYGDPKIYIDEVFMRALTLIRES